MIAKLFRSFSPRPFEVLLALAAILYAILFFNLAELRYLAFFSYEWEDLAQFNSVLWNLSSLNREGIIQIVQFNGDTNFHVPPIVFFLAIFYGLFPSIHFLFALIPAAIAVAAFPLFKIAHLKLGHSPAAFLIALSFLFYAPKNSLAFLDGDPAILALPLLTIAYAFAMEKRPKWFTGAIVLLCMCRTEAPLHALALSAYLWWSSGRRESLYLKTGIASGLWLAANLVIYAGLSSDGVFRNADMHGIADMLGVSENLFETALKLLLPVLLLPLFSRSFLIAVPAILFLLIQKEILPQRAHYIATFFPVAFIALIDVLARLRQPFRRVAVGMVLIGCVASNFAPNIVGNLRNVRESEIADRRFIGVNNLYDRSFYTPDPEDAVAWRMLKHIPAEASVAATGDLIGHLSSRKTLYEVLDPSVDYLDVDYVLLRRKNMYLGAGYYLWDESRISAALDQLRKSPEWRILDEESDLILFERLKTRRAENL